LRPVVDITKPNPSIMSEFFSVFLFLLTNILRSIVESLHRSPHVFCPISSVLFCELYCLWNMQFSYKFFSSFMIQNCASWYFPYEIHLSLSHSTSYCREIYNLYSLSVLLRWSWWLQLAQHINTYLMNYMVSHPSKQQFSGIGVHL
jgi:hypothetical protein